MVFWRHPVERAATRRAGLNDVRFDGDRSDGRQNGGGDLSGPRSVSSALSVSAGEIRSTTAGSSSLCLPTDRQIAHSSCDKSRSIDRRSIRLYRKPSNEAGARPPVLCPRGPSPPPSRRSLRRIPLLPLSSAGRKRRLDSV